MKALDTSGHDRRVPRDRQGSFEPVTVPKHARRLDGLAGNVISLYAKGLTTGDIQADLLEIYGTEGPLVRPGRTLESKGSGVRV